MPSAFPIAGLVPKTETQALQFSDKAKTRGHGIRIAVLDTGIDPAAAGLTSRVVDIIDATGCGDVKLREAKLVDSSDKSLVLQGSSGRQLLLNASWKNPSNIWKVAHKAAYDLWPDDLVSRRKKERKAAFDKVQAALLVTAQRDLTAFESADKDSKASKELPDDQEDPSKLKRKDLQDRVAALKDLSTSFEDAGPILDVVAWHDGTDWRSVVGGAEGDIPTDEVAAPLAAKEGDEPSKLDLSHLKPMTDFRKERHFERFGKQDLLSYSVNFYDDGEILSIAVVSGSHGTHVAGIIAANHPEQPELNGVAPEAELVSIRIGDPRVSGMETNQALVRAATAIVQTGCCLANMSFGENGAWGAQHKGAFFAQLVEEVVRKRDVIFCTSAGNSGPALTTIGDIPGGSETVFSIGAWVSGNMQDAEYALIDRVPSSIYTWSSRGPSFDGARGVLCYAPGAAITSVPLYNLKHTQLMNGTSMSCPSSCGNLALLLSKLKQDGKSWTPARVRQAVDLTSKAVGDATGVGLIQIMDAYEHLLAHYDDPDQDAEWLVQVTPPGRARTMRGVYLRGLQETATLQQFAVEVTPKFKAEETSKVYGLDLQLSLHCEASWVETPDFVAVNGLGRLFNIRVDPSKLESGLHATWIEGRLPDGRPVFKVPVTVGKPTLPAASTRTCTTFSPGQLQRQYIAVPGGATWAEVTVKATGRDTPCQFWLHAVQLTDLTRLGGAEMQSVYALTSGEPQSKMFSVRGGVTMELVATQAWNTAGKTDIEMVVDFHGLSFTSGPQLHLTSEEIQRIELASSIRPESIQPSIKFDVRRTVIRPKTAKVQALSARNVLASGQGQYELLLTYEFKQSKKAGVTARFATDGHLYDGPFSVLSVLYDSTRKTMFWGDVYPKEHELEKGDYTVQVQVVHQSFAVLEKLKGMAMNLDVKLAKAVTLGVYRDHVDALTSEKPYKFESVKLQAGSSVAAIVKTSFTDDELYKDAKYGDVLVGECHLTPPSHKLGFPATFTLPPAVPKEKEDTPDDKETQQLVDLQIEMGTKIEDSATKKRFLADLQTEHPNHLPLLVARLESLKPDEAEDESDILSAADAILQHVDEEALASFQGRQKSGKTAKDRKMAKSMQEKQEALVKAIDFKMRILHKRKPAVTDDDSYDKISPSSATSSASSRGSIYSSHGTLLAAFERWAPATDTKLALHLIQRDLDEERFGSALVKARKLLTELGEASSEPHAKEARQYREDAFKGLGWGLYLDMEARRTLEKDVLF